ncbi:MAG: hypothetical protein ACI4DX_16065 [Oliverpabstia sp.]
MKKSTLLLIGGTAIVISALLASRGKLLKKNKKSSLNEEHPTNEQNSEPVIDENVTDSESFSRSSDHETESEEEKFIRAWRTAFTEHGDTFNGLYQGLDKIMHGKAKKSERILKEFCQRTRYQWEGKEVAMLTEELVVPILDEDHREELKFWTERLLEAAAEAGISPGKTGEIILTEDNTRDYIDLNGEDLCEEDYVEVISPAWYQNGTLIEQGMCTKQQEE